MIVKYSDRNHVLLTRKCISMIYDRVLDTPITLFVIIELYDSWINPDVIFSFRRNHETARKDIFSNSFK